MAVTRLCKAGNSHGDEECPAVYTTDDPDWLIAQGKVLDALARAGLRDVAADESAVRIPTETVVRAVALLLVGQDRPDLADMVLHALAIDAVAST